MPEVREERSTLKAMRMLRRCLSPFILLIAEAVRDAA